MKKITLSNVSLLFLLLSSTYVLSKLKGKERNEPSPCSNSTPQPGGTEEYTASETAHTQQKKKIKGEHETNDTQGVKRGSVNLAPSALWELRRKLSAARSNNNNNNNELADSDSENNVVEEHTSKVPTFPEASVRTKPLTITTYHEGQDYRKATVSSEDSNASAEKFIFHLDNEPHLSVGEDVGDRNDDMPYLMKHQNTHSKYVVNIDDDEKVANFLKKTKEEEEGRGKNKSPPPPTTPSPTHPVKTHEEEDEDDNQLFAKHKANVKKEQQQVENVAKPKIKTKVRQENQVIETQKHKNKFQGQQLQESVKGEESKSLKPYMGEDPKLSGVPDDVYTGFKPSLRKPFSDREEDLNGEREDRPKKKTPEKAINYPSPHFAWQKEVVATQDDPEYVQLADENEIKEEKTQVQIRDENKKNVSYTPVIVAEKVTNYSNDTMDVFQRQDMISNFTNLNGSNSIPSDEYFVASESLESDMNAENPDLPNNSISPSPTNKVEKPYIKPSNVSPMKDTVPSTKDASLIKEDISSFMKEDAESLVDDNHKNPKIAKQYQQDNDDDNLKISEQMDKLLIKEKVAQGKKNPNGKLALTEISKTGNLTNPNEFIHSSGKQLVMPGRFAGNLTMLGDDSFIPGGMNFKNTGNNFIGNGSMNEAYEDDFTNFDNSNLNTAKELKDIGNNMYPESGRIDSEKAKVADALKPIPPMKGMQSYATSHPGLSKFSSNFMAPHVSLSNSNRKLPALLSNKMMYSPTENLIISKKLREIDSRAKATLNSLNNVSLTHGPETKEQFFQKERNPMISDIAAIPAQVVLSPDNIAKLSGYKKPQEINNINEQSIHTDPFHQKMAAYDNYLKHVGSNVIDTDACLRSDDPLKCENKEILKSSAVISKLDKELSKISSSAINELNQELSRTPTPGASIVKITKPSSVKELKSDSGDKLFDSPPDDAMNDSSRSSTDINDNLDKSKSIEDFTKDESDKSSDEFTNPNPMESFAEPSKEEMDKDFTLNPSFDPMKKHSPHSSSILHACQRSDDPIKCQNKELNKELTDKEESQHTKSSSESLLSFSSDPGSKSIPDDNLNPADTLLASSINPLKPFKVSLKDMENGSESSILSAQQQQQQQQHRQVDRGSDNLIDLESSHGAKSNDKSHVDLTTSMFKHLKGDKVLSQLHHVNVLGKANAMAEKVARIKAARYILAQKNRFAMELKRRKVLADEARLFAAACRQGKDIAEMKKRGLISEKMPLSCSKKFNGGKQMNVASRQHQIDNNNLNIINSMIKNHNNKNTLLLSKEYKAAFKTASNRSLPESNFISPTTNSALANNQLSKKYVSVDEVSTGSTSLSNTDHKYGTLLHKLSNLKSLYSSTRPTSIFNSKITKMLSKQPSESMDHFNSRAFGRKFSTFSSVDDNPLVPYKPPHPKGPSIVFDQFTSVGGHGGALVFPAAHENTVGGVVTRTHIWNNGGKHSHHQHKHNTHQHKHNTHQRTQTNKHLSAKKVQTRDDRPQKVKTGPNYGYGSGNGHGYGTNSWGWGGGGGWAGKPPPGGIPSPGEYGPPGSSSEPAQDQPAQPAAPAKPATPAAPSAPSAPAAPAALAAPAAPPPAPSSPSAVTGPSNVSAVAPSLPPQTIHETNKTTNKTMEEKGVNMKVISSKEKQFNYVQNEPTEKALSTGKLKKNKTKSSANSTVIKTNTTFSLDSQAVRNTQKTRPIHPKIM